MPRRTPPADKAKREQVETRNQLEATVHSVEKNLSEHGDKLPAADKGDAEGAVAAAKVALEGTDLEALKAASERLTAAAMKIGEAVYKAQSEAPAACRRWRQARRRAWWTPSSRKSTTRRSPPKQLALPEAVSFRQRRLAAERAIFRAVYSSDMAVRGWGPVGSGDGPWPADAGADVATQIDYYETLEVSRDVNGDELKRRIASWR